jgi:hypothetical protein
MYKPSISIVKAGIEIKRDTNFGVGKSSYASRIGVFVRIISQNHHEYEYRCREQELLIVASEREYLDIYFLS